MRWQQQRPEPGGGEEVGWRQKQERGQRRKRRAQAEARPLRRQPRFKAERREDTAQKQEGRWRQDVTEHESTQGEDRQVGQLAGS